MNVKNLVFIADKGFYSLTNITQLKESKLHYIILTQRTESLIDFCLLLNVNFKKELTGYFKYQERILWYHAYQKEGQQLVTFLDEKLRVKEESDYLLQVNHILRKSPSIIFCYKLFTRLKKQDLIQKYSPKDIIEFAKAT